MLYNYSYIVACSHIAIYNEHVYIYMHIRLTSYSCNIWMAFMMDYVYSYSYIAN